MDAEASRRGKGAKKEALLTILFSTGTGWENTEYRSYEFVEPAGEDTQASIRETKTSWRRRRGSSNPLTETEQQQLRSVVVARYNEHYETINGAPAQ